MLIYESVVGPDMFHEDVNAKTFIQNAVFRSPATVTTTTTTSSFLPYELEEL
jgi:hypothetical protein